MMNEWTPLAAKAAGRILGAGQDDEVAQCLAQRCEVMVRMTRLLSAWLSEVKSWSGRRGCSVPGSAR